MNPHFYPFLLRSGMGAAPPPPPPPPPDVGLGWTQLLGTTILAVAPPNGYGGPADYYGNPVQFHDLMSAPAGLMAWSSGCMDTLRNRMIVLGGGHQDYPGNELYSVSLNTLTTTRLNNPTIPTNHLSPFGLGTLSDGKPNNRHTFGGICYIEHADRLFMYGGVPTDAGGGFLNDTWTCNLANLVWTNMNPAGVLPLTGFSITHGGNCAYDPNTGLVFMHDSKYLTSYNYDTNTWVRYAASALDLDTDHHNAVIDPVRRRFLVFFSNSYKWIDINPATSTYTWTGYVTPSGGGPDGYPLGRGSALGLSYDPPTDRIIAWDGGDAWSLDVDAEAYTQLLFTGDDTAPASQTVDGTFGRFAYSPTSGCHLLVNHATQNAFTLKITGHTLSVLTLTSPTTATLPFTVGLGFKKGDVANSPKLNISEYQAVVKASWNDGSVKHAIVSGQVALTADTPFSINVVGSGAAPSGTDLTAASIAAAAPTASVQCGSIGTVSLSSLLATPVRTWVSGPEMVECHYRSAVGSDATLAVEFHVRLFKGGRKWIRAVVENGYLDVTTVDKTYVPTVIIGGVTVYNNSGSSLLHCAHTRWTAEGWIGGNPGVFAAHDIDYLNETKLVPNYWKRSPSTFSSLYTAYTPMGNGNHTAAMHAPGFQAALGLLPQWDALYATSASKTAFDSMLANSSFFNSYPICWKDSATGEPMKPSTYPTYVIDGGTDSLTTTAGLEWEINHAPSAGYLAYLCTGDYWHYQTLLLQASLIYMVLPSSRGSGLSKYLSAQTRGFAWNVRTFSQLAAIAPDDDVADDYRAVLSYNVVNYNALAAAQSGSGIGYLSGYENGTNVYGTGLTAPWMHHWFMQVLGMASDIEPLDNMTDLNGMRDWMYRGVVGILGPSSAFCFNYASQYNLKIDDVSGDFNPANWYQTWATVFTESVAAGVFTNFGCSNTLLGNSGGDPTNAPEGYWGNLLPAIAYAVDHAATGAAASWARLIGATNWSAIENGVGFETGLNFNNLPNFGIVPRGFA